MSRRTDVDIAVLTVITPELDAALRALGISLEQRVKDEGTIYYYGTIHSALRHRDYRLVLTCIGGAGNPSAAAATSEIIEKFNPRAVLLMGIAAGIRDKGVWFSFCIAECGVKNLPAVEAN